MSSKYIKICENCKNILHKQIQDYNITYKCQSCQSVFDSTDEDTMILEVRKGILRKTQKKGENIYFHPANPKEKTPCVNSKCNVQIVRFEREEDGRKKYGCKCGTVWAVNHVY
jgi:DNA-directed RNA polymerase subunit M/transcription elongation factor TFIIS